MIGDREVPTSSESKNELNWNQFDLTTLGIRTFVYLKRVLGFSRHFVFFFFNKCQVWLHSTHLFTAFVASGFRVGLFETKLWAGSQQNAPRPWNDDDVVVEDEDVHFCPFVCGERQRREEGRRPADRHIFSFGRWGADEGQPHCRDGVPATPGCEDLQIAEGWREEGEFYRVVVNVAK